MATTAQGYTTERRIGAADRRSESRMAHRAHMNAIDWIAMILLIVGGVNWGLVGLLNFDLVATLFGPMSLISRIVYILVGLSALWAIYTTSKMSRS